ncbi:hypothetical protein COV49_01510 [Candidatus Falkowbacteria bacterium CG11_big_fil_rev_8_21_14_0_20_39_10]|uniref:Uncharacterized protein n=1 Tax=Candidatus Falkowbacteria bacterium CG11_big_fil_rev_8_21_14_0_20_39_10 TaxID=1974570 RepID=A0A2M6K9H0_9BACT|nr:MAG: hypothetical protein COV49_01510 [Candidatus Falkowbacteria bacterium CG11_big_fil_rev_8_21_14_0_20_39_10]
MAKQKIKAGASPKKRPAGKKKQEQKIQKTKEIKEASPTSGGVMAVAAVIVVGIIIFVWQSHTGKRVREAQNENKNIKSELTNLKNSLFSVQSENEELKVENEDLKTMTEVLPNSKTEFKNTKLGLNFVYPAVWGEMKLTASAGDAGKQYKGEFSHNGNLVLGGIDSRFSSSGEKSFLDTQGFRKRSGVYFYKSTGEDTGDQSMATYRIQPVEVINFSGGEILIVDSSSFIDENLELAVMFSPGQNGLGALVNLDNGLFPGLAIWDKDTSQMPLENFKEFLQTLTVEAVGGGEAAVGDEMVSE